MIISFSSSLSNYYDAGGRVLPLYHYFIILMFYTICVFCTVRVYTRMVTRTVRFSVPYAYGIDIRVWYVPYAYYAFSQYLLALPSPSYNGLSLQVFLAEQT